jgi:hypothetical protein
MHSAIVQPMFSVNARPSIRMFALQSHSPKFVGRDDHGFKSCSVPLDRSPGAADPFDY